MRTRKESRQKEKKRPNETAWIDLIKLLAQVFYVRAKRMFFFQFRFFSFHSFFSVCFSVLLRCAVENLFRSIETNGFIQCKSFVALRIDDSLDISFRIFRMSHQFTWPTSWTHADTKQTTRNFIFGLEAVKFFIVKTIWKSSKWHIV